MSAQNRRPLALLVLDGWGYRPEAEGNAIRLAETPFYDEIVEKYPQTLLEASGVRVGLPAGVMGNSEVGHLNIGSGRVIRTDVGRIDHQIETGELFRDELLVSTMRRAKERGTALHLMGLVSDGKVHSSQDHLYALIHLAKQEGLDRVYIHCFLDGRDTPPASAFGYVEALQAVIARAGTGRIASLVGRFYAMDRDRRWERTQKAYDLLVKGTGTPALDPATAVKDAYERSTTDEFIEPIVITRDGENTPVATMRDGDAVIFFNYRADRTRQITSALTQSSFDGFDVSDRPALEFVCMTRYDKEFALPFVFAPLERRNILAEVFARADVRNYRIAETEKYAHVTYFFNGGTEKEFGCESRLLVPSVKGVTTYDQVPEMSAFKITDKVLRQIDEGDTDVFIVNFANADMVGHSGKLDKTIEAVQYVDTCLGWIAKAVRARGGTLLVTADHGNAEQMIDFSTGQPHTAHTTNLVPFHLVGEEFRGATMRDGGALQDIAPTILGLLDVEQPEEMTGRDLREK